MAHCYSRSSHSSSSVLCGAGSSSYEGGGISKGGAGGVVRWQWCEKFQAGALLDKQAFKVWCAGLLLTTTYSTTAVQARLEQFYDRSNHSSRRALCGAGRSSFKCRGIGKGVQGELLSGVPQIDTSGRWPVDPHVALLPCKP